MNSIRTNWPLPNAFDIIYYEVTFNTGTRSTSMSDYKRARDLLVLPFVNRMRNLIEYIYRSVSNRNELSAKRREQKTHAFIGYKIKKWRNTLNIAHKVFEGFMDIAHHNEHDISEKEALQEQFSEALTLFEIFQRNCYRHFESDIQRIIDVAETSHELELIPIAYQFWTSANINSRIDTTRESIKKAAIDHVNSEIQNVSHIVQSHLTDHTELTRIKEEATTAIKTLAENNSITTFAYIDELNRNGETTIDKCIRLYDRQVGILKDSTGIIEPSSQLVTSTSVGLTGMNINEYPVQNIPSPTPSSTE